MTRTIAIALSLGLLTSAAWAQPAPETFKFLSAKDVGALTDKPATGPVTAHLAEHPGYDVEYAQRGDSGNMVEVHAHTTHYIHILEGQGTLTYGGTVNAGKETAPGEIRGPGVTGGTVLALHAGDYVQIAAGTKIRYIVFNIKS